MEGTYDFYITEDITEREARTIALERAKVNALAEAFGTYISSSSTLTSKETSYGDSESFNAFSSADIAGIWVKTIDEKVQRNVIGDDIVLRASVKGMARPRDISSVEFEAVIGKVGSDGSFIPSNKFLHRERFDITFKSPLSGWLAVYASDGVNDAARLIPDVHDNLFEPVHVDANIEYRLFGNASPVMRLDTDEESALMRFTVVFLPENKGKPFSLPTDNLRTDDQGYLAGCNVSNDSYQKWLSRMMGNSHLQRRDILAKITRK